LKLHFQTCQEQGMILSSNCIIKNKELICQPWFLLDFGTPFLFKGMLNGEKFTCHSIVIVIGKYIIFLIKSNKY
jgi:hypothetical protein